MEFTPTVEHCSMATLIGLCIRVKLLRVLPPRFKVGADAGCTCCWDGKARRARLGGHGLGGGAHVLDAGCSSGARLTWVLAAQATGTWRAGALTSRPGSMARLQLGGADVRQTGCAVDTLPHGIHGSAEVMTQMHGNRTATNPPHIGSD